jgi:AcrR family transcriptional regulator
MRATGYRKGDETRQRILDAALGAFGEASYKAVTTRQLAEAARVSLPTLNYYFGGKEGLYRACAEAIVERYRSHASSAAAEAVAALRADCPPAAARAHLKAVVAALAALLVGSTEAGSWAPFVAGELREPGPAFEILYENLWRPGTELVTRLVARILEVPASDPAPRMRALLLISSLVAFQSGRTIALRAMEWSSIGPGELATVVAAIDAQIDALRPARG